MSRVPADPAGETAVIWLEELTVKLFAAVEPKNTDPAPVRLSPVMVTLVPPATGPDVGETEVMEGGDDDGGGGGVV